MTNKFFKTNNYGYLVGEISDNVFHKHYAVQVVVSLTNNIEVQFISDQVQSPLQIIQSMHTHKLNCKGQQVLILLINPISNLGHILNKHNQKLSQQSDWGSRMRKLAQSWQTKKINDIEFKIALERILQDFVNLNINCLKHSDKRILTALDLLNINPEIIMPLETLARQVNLSPSRFIHLFKSETGISYRRMQLWNKLMASIDGISQYKSITDLAHAHGFSDSAHYSRTFKQTFGLNPKVLIKHSQFIQF